MAEQARRLANRFDVDRVAGSGAMGVVYHARDTFTGEEVALKLLRTASDSDVRRFAREARALAELRHPGIVRYVAHGASPEGEHWLAMEWLEGETLAERLARQGLSIDESVRVVLHAAEAVGVLHHRGMLHRDLKPSNLFLVRKDIERVKVLDFGLARLGLRSPEVSATGMLLGTPNYMSPEQAQGSKSIDARADVFALGCVLFKCLTGQAPFRGDDATQVLTRLLFEPAPTLRSLVPDAPAALEAVLSRALSKSPDARATDAERFAAELRALGPLDPRERMASAVEPRAPGLTGTEQHLFALLAAGRDFRLPEAEPTHVERRSADLTTAAMLRTTVQVSGGKVEEQSEDSLLVTFSAHGTAIDLAVRAARCAHAIRAVWPEPPIAVAMGWARGKSAWKESDVSARVGTMLARAGESAAPRTLVDRMMQNLLDGRFEVTAEGAELELRAERELAGPARTLLGKPSPCVGRDREIALLLSVYEEAASEPRSRIAVVTAPAGAGKSRVRHEVLRKVRERGDGAEIWLARGDQMSAGSPFALLAPMVRKIAGIRDGEPELLRQQKLRARVARHLREQDRARVTDFIGELAGVPMPDAASVLLRTARENPMTMGDQIARAFEDWVAAECAVHPVMLVLDDMQWGDWPSAKLVDGALRNLGELPLCVLTLARPEVDDVLPGLFKGRDAYSLRLGPIGKKAAESLTRDMLGDAATDSVVTRVVELASGNVFYLEELIRAVAEGRGDALPDTVVAMVQERATALEPEARRVLRAAAVFGQVFWRGGLLTLLGGPKRGEMLDDVLDELTAAELIGERAESRFPGEREFVFRHGLVRDGAYALLTAEDRALGHRLAGEWLEASGERGAGVLAEHFERGGDGVRAAECWSRAAEQALEGNDFLAAIECVRRGMGAGAEGEKLGRLWLVLARARRWRAEQAESEHAALNAMKLLPPGGREWLDAIGEAAPAACRLGHGEELDRLAEALEAAKPDPRFGSALASAAGMLGVQLAYMGRFADAKRLLARIEQIPSIAQEPLVEAWRNRLAGFLAQFEGDAAAYLRGSELASIAFARAGDQRQASALAISMGYALLTMGRYEEAEQRLRGALAVGLRIGLPTPVTLAKHNLGLVLARQGRVEDGLRLETEAVEECEKQGDRRIESGARAYLADILLEAGDFSKAIEQAQRSYDVSPDPSRAFALALMADAHLRRGEVDAAAARSLEAMALLERLGGIEEGAVRVRLVRAKVLGALGNRGDAVVALRGAVSEIKTRAKRLTDDVSRTSFLTRVPENREALALADAWGLTAGA